MAALPWDRLFETCSKQQATQLMLHTGSPPLILFAGKWIGLKVDALTPENIIEMTAALLPPHPPSDIKEYSGYSYWHVRYGNEARYRAMAFGFPQTKTLLLVRIGFDEGSSTLPSGSDGNLPLSEAARAQ